MSSDSLHALRSEIYNSIRSRIVQMCLDVSYSCSSTGRTDQGIAA